MLSLSEWILSLVVHILTYQGYYHPVSESRSFVLTRERYQKKVTLRWVPGSNPGIFHSKSEKKLWQTSNSFNHCSSKLIYGIQFMNHGSMLMTLKPSSSLSPVSSKQWASGNRSVVIEHGQTVSSDGICLPVGWWVNNEWPLPSITPKVLKLKKRRHLKKLNKKTFPFNKWFKNIG